MLLVHHNALSGLKNSEVAILMWGTKNVDQKGVIYYELLKPGETWLILSATDNKWSIWIKLCVKNDHNIKKGNTK